MNLIGLETWTFEQPEGPISIKTRNCLRTDHGESARDAAINGLGINLCSTWCCYQQVERGELIQVLKNFPLVSNTAIWAVYPSSRLLAPKVRAFIDYCADSFGNRPYWDSIFT